MRKFLLSLLIIEALFIGGYFSYRTFYLKPVAEPVKPAEDKPIIKVEPDLNRRVTVISGRSMEPTLPSGSNQAFIKSEPQINDVISFKCVKTSCQSGSAYEHNGNSVKRLIKIRADGAWWVLGDNPQWTESDGIHYSFDSRYFGWVLPSERTDVWVWEESRK